MMTSVVAILIVIQECSTTYHDPSIELHSDVFEVKVSQNLIFFLFVVERFKVKIL